MMEDPFEQHHEVLKSAGWPDALIKATFDSFEYALMLKTGAVLYFTDATPICDGSWVALTLDRVHCEVPDTWSSSSVCVPPFFERGIEVRVSEIVWVADCPYGS